MKQFLYNFIHLSFFSLLSYSAVFGQQEFDPSSATKEAEGIINQAESINYKLNTDVNALFGLVKETIKDTDKATAKLTRKFSEKTGGELSKKERQELLDIIRIIHGNYKSIDENRTTLHDLLSNYDGEIEAEVTKAKVLVKKYRKELAENQTIRDELQNKFERSPIEEADLKNSEFNIRILGDIIRKLEGVELMVEKIRQSYTRTNNEITTFFNTVKNARKTTGYLVTYFELDIAYGELQEKAENILRLDELTREITRSLEDLLNSLQELRRTANGL